MTWFLPLTLLLLPAYLIRFDLFGMPTTVLEILIYLGVLGLLISQPLAHTGENLKAVWRSYGWPISLIALGALVGTIIAPDLRSALGLLKGYFIDPLLLFFVITTTNLSKSVNRKQFSALALSGCIIAISALFITNIEGRALGLYVIDTNPSPNYPALYLAPIGALIIGLIASRATDKKQRLFLAIAALLILTATILTNSRGAELALLAALCLAIIKAAAELFFKNRPIFATTASILLIIAALAGGYAVARPNFGDTATARQTTSNNLRYEIWHTTITDILPRKAWLGVGLGNYQAYFTERTAKRVNFPEFVAPWARTPHNFFLNIWVNIGLLGLAGTILVLIRFFRDIAAAAGKQPFAYAIGLAMITLLIHGLVDSAYWKNDLAALFWVLIALGYREVHDDAA